MKKTLISAVILMNLAVAPVYAIDMAVSLPIMTFPAPDDLTTQACFAPVDLTQGECAADAQ